MPVPLAVAAPAAVASIAYLNARTSFSYDYRFIGSVIKAKVSMAVREKKDRLNMFYVLEDHALGKNANEIFLVFEGKQWSYKESYENVLKYGSWLAKKHNVKSKEVVAMDFVNSDQFVFLWFALWSLGAKPAFINYNLAGKALEHCIRVSTTRLVLVDLQMQDNITQEMRDALPSVQFDIFNAVSEAEVLSTDGVRLPDSWRTENEASDMASLIYTSGTTGLPKPAIVSWAKVVTASVLVPSWSSISRSDVLYTCMPLYHSSAALIGLCSVLHAGATLSLGKKFSTKTFWQDVRNSKATVIQYVGETCRYLLAAPPQIDPVTGVNIDQANSVRMALGNGLRPDVWNKFKQRFGIEVIAEFYSATEGASASWNYSKNDFSKGAIGRNGSMGGLMLSRGWAPVELDWDTESPWRDPVTGFCKKVKPGDAGEMLYKLDPANIKKGFQGYFNNTESTESKIMRDVFVKGDAWFRTGDMISWDSEGRTYFNDRIGDTFRWKSENVSTNEVSEALGSHPAVLEANVYGVELPNHDGRAGCVALVLSDDPSEKLLSSLAELAHKSLPRYAVPLFLRLTKEMQTTGTNKQQKHVVRTQGVNPSQTGEDQLFWLKGGTYVKFGTKDWEELHGGRVRL